MSCIIYQNTNNYEGSVYVSGTTCEGQVGAFTLYYGDDICMNVLLPLITCENPEIVGYCVNNPTPTPSHTPTPTPTPPPTSTPTSTTTPTPTSTRNVETSTPTPTPTPTSTLNLTPTPTQTPTGTPPPPSPTPTRTPSCPYYVANIYDDACNLVYSNVIVAVNVYLPTINYYYRGSGLGDGTIVQFLSPSCDFPAYTTTVTEPGSFDCPPPL